MRVVRRIIGGSALATLYACAGLLELDEVGYPTTADSAADGATAQSDGESTSDGPGVDQDAPSCGADLDHDKANCGRCGNQCPVACALGHCVDVIASGLAQPTRMEVRDGRIHWLDFADGLGVGDVSSASLDGGARLTRPFANPADLGLGASTLYVWSNASNGVAQGPGLFLCDPNGPCEDAGIAASTSSPVGLAVGAGRVGWCDSTKLVTCTDGACRASRTSILLADKCSGPSVDDAGFCVVANAVHCETDGGFAPTGLTGANRVVVAGDRVYAPTGASASSSPRVPGGGATRLFQVTNQVREIAVDATHIYFTSADAGYVGRCPLTGCTTPEILVRGLARPWSVFLAGTDVYLSIAGTLGKSDGMIVRFPK